MVLKAVYSTNINSKEMIERCVKTFLDLLILGLLKEKPSCGYEILAAIHNKFNILLSPGTIYPLLYTLEENGLVRSQNNNRKKDYVLSPKGETILGFFSKNFHSSSIQLLNTINGDN